MVIKLFYVCRKRFETVIKDLEAKQATSQETLAKLKMEFDKSNQAAAAAQVTA